jgi:hypothetical protein
MDLKSEEVHDHVETLRNGMRHDEDNISISAGARGDNLPEGYFMSLQFIAVVLVSPIQSLEEERTNTDRG